MSKLLNKFVITTALVVTPVVSQALPIDWHGVFGVDSTLISDFRRIKSETVSPTNNDGSQEVGLDNGNKASASWQSYVFRLSPTMIINDAATFKGEITSGYANGGYLGDAPEVNQTATNTVSLYHQNQAAGQSLNIKQAFVELYSDTATYVIGRHTYHWGLGAIYNDGANTWDRHAYSRDGITMKLKIGNFHLSPFYSKISNPGYTKATSAKELGIGLLYDNDERDIGFGMHYAVKSSSANNPFYTSSIETAEQSVGETDVKITDIYFRKTFGSLSFGIEVPLVAGDIGKTTSTSSITSVSSKAFLLQANYKAKDELNFGFDGGVVNGHDGSSGTFGALYLHPNYQIANLLFRYNLASLGSNSTDGIVDNSVYDSYITNTMFFKLKSAYTTEKWIFESAIIYAIAQETAHAGQKAFNHTKNKIFTANFDQDDSLGTEIDLNATYKWNNEVQISGALGYLFTGDYFGYTNTATTNEAKNSMVLQINTSVTF